jgi:hypothetical protein
MLPFFVDRLINSSAIHFGTPQYFVVAGDLDDSHLGSSCYGADFAVSTSFDYVPEGLRCDRFGPRQCLHQGCLTIATAGQGTANSAQQMLRSGKLDR